jgi:hypothetical protein
LHFSVLPEALKAQMWTGLGPGKLASPHWPAGSRSTDNGGDALLPLNEDGLRADQVLSAGLETVF